MRHLGAGGQVRVKVKKIQASTGFKLMTSAIPAQCSTNWANKPPESWSRYRWWRYKWKGERSSVYFNSGERYEEVIDHSSYTRLKNRIFSIEAIFKHFFRTLKCQNDPYLGLHSNQVTKRLKSCYTISTLSSISRSYSKHTPHQILFSIQRSLEPISEVQGHL